MTQARSTWLPLLAAVPAVLLAVQVHFTCGIVYSLDDPYIHLALARQILHGHYGINPGEFSAPSSSILWPFLLAPLAFTRLYEFLPLAMNLVALAVGVWWLARWLETYLSPWPAVLATTAIAFALNLYGLVLTGMENSLQVTLTIIIAVSFVESRLRWPFWFSIVLLPFIRYEGLAISLPALAYLFVAGERRGKALVSGALIAAVVGGFSLFLYSHGAGLLPASVLAKNGVRMMRELRGLDAILDNLTLQAVFVMMALFAALLLVRNGLPGAALFLLIVPTALHLLFGKYGWFARYHIYFAAWIGILFVGAYARSGLAAMWPLNVILVAAFAWASVDPMIATLTTASGARNIADQQKQMALIARDYLDEPVAVNDLGFVSFYARHYVLDLAGLASRDALLAQADPATDMWVPRLMAAHKVEQAMVFDGWLKKRPASWIKVATLTLPLPWISVGDDHVSFYSASPDAAARLRQALERYRKSSRQAAMMLTLEPQ
jgi:hypothetical protein